MVSAFASEARLVLTQEKVADKSNEITAIPDVIDMLDLKDSIVTIDAMGCQKAISQKIMDAGGDYVIALKANQDTLHKSVAKHFNNTFDMGYCKRVDVCEVKELNRDREEQRKCWVTDAIEQLKLPESWPGMKSCLLIESNEYIKEKKLLKNAFISAALKLTQNYIIELCVRIGL